MVPSLDDLASDRLTHGFGDLFNPPALTNFLGCVGAAVDVTGITNLTFPPFSSAETLTAALRVNGRHFQSVGVPVTFQWFPDRIEREAVADGLRFRTTTVMAVDTMGVQVELEVQNLGGSSRTLELGLSFQGGVTKTVTNWTQPVPPFETDNAIQVQPSHGRLVFSAKHSCAVVMQGVWPLPDSMTPATAAYKLVLKAGERRLFSIFWVVDEDVGSAGQCYDELIARRDVLAHGARQAWEREIEALFTPNNDAYSGHLPSLTIDEPGVQKLYWMGALGVAYFRRDSPYSQVGRVYDTLMPRYWQSVMVLWDYSLSAPCHAMLDPLVMRTTLERWMRTDVHTHFGTSYLTGEPIGPWYAVNDYAMASMAHQYITWTGNLDWLTSEVTSSGKPVVDFLVEFATSWKQFVQSDGLAGYGGLFNLLECVSSYVHEIASLNAANVYIMRTTADLLAAIGRERDAQVLRDDARSLYSKLQQLYVPGGGFWYARRRDGALTEVRHAYDLLTVLNCVPDDLSAAQKREMARFFQRELRTDTWMYALSPKDPDALFSLRPDHQWNGAYPAWPPETAKGLFRIGESAVAFEWLKGLARSANQGPFGQAHFVEAAVPGESGGARKASAESPYINDWHSSSSGSWVSAVVEGLIGIRVSARRGITASLCPEAVECHAALSNIPFQGKLYRADADGVHLQ